MLAELTDLLELAQVGLSIAEVEVTGDGVDAVTTLTLDDGTPVYFERLEHVARADKLAAQLASAVGVWAEFTPLQARRASGLIRRHVGRARAVSERGRVIELGLELLAAADPEPFRFNDQASRWRAWSMVDDTDPATETVELDGGRSRQQAVYGADPYAARVVVPRDEDSGDRFVRAGWMQEFARRRGTRHNANALAGLLEHVGWHRRGREGRIKATEPAGDRTIVMSFYVVPKAWVERHEATGEEAPGDDG